MIRTVKALNVGANIEREYTCEQWALMNGVPPSGWAMVSNTCQLYLEKFYSPFASFTPDFGAGGIVVGAGRWYLWEGVIGGANSDRLMIPTADLQLPSTEANVLVTVRRQDYLPSEPGKTRDFFVNTVDNSIDFVVGSGKPSLNTLKAYVKVWKT